MEYSIKINGQLQMNDWKVAHINLMHRDFHTNMDRYVWILYVKKTLAKLQPCLNDKIVTGFLCLALESLDINREHFTWPGYLFFIETIF